MPVFEWTVNSSMPTGGSNKERTSEFRTTATSRTTKDVHPTRLSAGDKVGAMVVKCGTRRPQERCGERPDARHRRRKDRKLEPFEIAMARMDKQFADAYRDKLGVRGRIREWPNDSSSPFFVEE